MEEDWWWEVFKWYSNESIKNDLFNSYEPSMLIYLSFIKRTRESTIEWMVNTVIENSKEVSQKDEKEVLDLLDWQTWELVLNSATIIEKEVIIIILKEYICDMVHTDNTNMYTAWQVNVSQSYSMLCQGVNMY